ncbi:MAG: hypothetical protein KAS32_05745 [Candidatus Peribacteraceae bacterium]|nr:hypothetical protein [Candidatus Peribacteraceae bacterium]
MLRIGNRDSAKKTLDAILTKLGYTQKDFAAMFLMSRTRVGYMRKGWDNGPDHEYIMMQMLLFMVEDKRINTSRLRQTLDDFGVVSTYLGLVGYFPEEAERSQELKSAISPFNTVREYLLN